MKVIAWDTETELITETDKAPRIACLTWSTGKDSGILGARDGIPDFVGAHDDYIWVAHNAAFDAAVLLRNFPELNDWVWRKYLRREIHDTMIIESLRNIADGSYKQRRGKLSLAALAYRYLHQYLDKSEDTWRLRYGELIDLPIDQWPKDAVSYAVGDAATTLKVYNLQPKPKDHANQAAYHVALHMLSVRGICTDVGAVAELRESLRLQQIDLQQSLVDRGLLRRELKVRTDRIAKRAEERWPAHEKTTTGKTPKKLSEIIKAEEPDIAWDKKLTRHTKILEAIVTAASDGDPMRTAPSKTFPGGKIDISSDVLDDIKDPDIQTLQKYKHNEKLLSTYLSNMATGEIHARFNPLVESGRTSCVTGNTLIPTKDGIKQAKDLAVGDLVWTHKQRWKKVIDAWCLPEKRMVYRVTLSNGCFFECTGNHRLLFSDGRWAEVYACIQKMVEHPTTKTTCPPHRRQWRKQRSGQFSLVHSKRTQNDTQFAETRSCVVEIEKIEGAGNCLVYDYTVDSDESYEVAGGVFSHNCSQPNIQNLPRAVGVRDCFVPRPGYVFAACDYDAAELKALAQVTYSLFGYSAMRDSILEGKDLHLELAAQLMGISYEDAVRRKESGDKAVKEMRQMGKCANFGYPGGLGVKTFVKFAKGSGVILAEDFAAKLRQVWFSAFPEMEDYFGWISKKVKEGSVCAVEQFKSGRVRGGLRFTAAANTMFQGLVADAAKHALFEVTRECYTDKLSPMRGSYPVVFVHDEIILECPKETAAAAAERLRDLMVDTAQRWMPDVPVTAGVHLMERWQKDADAVRNEKGELIPWAESDK